MRLAVLQARMIQIRNVPDELHPKLKIQAAKEGITLSELLAREARRLAEEPTVEEMRERFLALPPVRVGTSAAAMIRRERHCR